MGDIARDNDLRALAIGGVEDHVHLLLSIPSTLSIAKAMQLIKGGSSKWIHETFPNQKSFEWQEGTGRSASEFHKSRTRRPTSPISENITGERHIRKNSSQ
jgi:REP element-mobilizing transposase RayT